MANHRRFVAIAVSRGGCHLDCGDPRERPRWRQSSFFWRSQWRRAGSLAKVTSAVKKRPRVMIAYQRKNSPAANRATPSTAKSRPCASTTPNWSLPLSEVDRVNANPQILRRFFIGGTRSVASGFGYPRPSILHPRHVSPSPIFPARSRKFSSLISSGKLCVATCAQKAVSA